MNNNWYFNSNIPASKKLLSEEGKIEFSNTLVYKIDTETSLLIEELLISIFSDYGHKCISVYRDGIILNNKVYNICLSCGDVIIDGKVNYFTDTQLLKLQDIKNKIITKNIL